MSPGESASPTAFLCLIPKGLHLQKMCPETMDLITREHPNSLPEAGGITGVRGTSNLSHPGSLPFPQTVVLKVIGVHCQWHLLCHPGLTAQMDPDILDEIGGTDKKHA